MMSPQTLILARDDRGVVTVSLNRPQKRNALSPEMIGELHAAADSLAADSTVRVVVLKGEGPLFCAGGDLDWMRAQFEGDRVGRIAEAMRLARALRALDRLPKPLICRIHGGAYGGGVGLASVADVVVADADARFGLTETRLGLIPATISPYVAARVGAGAVRRLVTSPRLLGAKEAKAIGLVARVADAGDLDAAVEAEIAAYLTAAPGAVTRAKALALSLTPEIDDHRLAETAALLADAWEDPEAREGVAAFFERRQPIWARP